MVVKIRFGAGNSVEKDFPEGTTVGQILANAQVKAALQFGENVRPKISGVVQGHGSPVSHGDTIELESAANGKAVR